MKKYCDSDINNKHFSFSDFVNARRKRIDEELITTYFDKESIYTGDVFESFRSMKYKPKHTHFELFNRNAILLKITDNSYIDISSLKSKEDITCLLRAINIGDVDENLIVYSGISITEPNNKLVLNIRPYKFKNKKEKQRVISIR